MNSFKMLDGDADLNKVQQNVALALNPILNSEIVNGTQIDDIELISGSNIINHRLGREPRGYIIVRKSANVSIYDTEITKNVLKLTSSGAAVISLWVY